MTRHYKRRPDNCVDCGIALRTQGEVVAGVTRVHYAHGLCTRCKYRGTGSTPPVRRVPVRCGTPAGYQRHHLQGEKPCLPCRVARAEYRRAHQALLTSLGLAPVSRRKASPGQRVRPSSHTGQTSRWWWECQHDHAPGTPARELVADQDEAYAALSRHNAEHHPDGLRRPLEQTTGAMS